MSLEQQPQSKTEIPTIADLQAADELIAENAILAGNPRVKYLQENNFVTEEGRQLDAGDFLSAMLNFLQTQGVDATTADLDQALDSLLVN